MKTSRLEESGLVTHGRHHVPGYGGFCPQMRFEYGKTFGKTTASLLSEKDVASSGNKILVSTTPEPTSKDKVEEFRLHLINTRDDGDNKFTHGMVPGYMGFVPRKRNYFGSRFADVCKNSTADLELDRRKVAYRKDELEFIKAVQDGTIEIAPEDLPPHLMLSPRAMSTEAGKTATSKAPTPNPTLTPKAAPLVSPEPRVYSTSPYDIKNQDPTKTFKAGYSGFVPRLRGMFGQGYPEVVNKALNTFQEDRLGHHSARDASDTPVRAYQHQPPPQRPLYPEENGMTPRYTGHIPGVRFRHGMTFGRSTKNTKNFEMPDVSI